MQLQGTRVPSLLIYFELTIFCFTRKILNDKFVGWVAWN
eukprot:SAG11_NODE_19009_length_476_cov_0.644562_2_plen_38_part_01